MTRTDCLDAAKAAVCGQREQDYGKPENHFQMIADMWTVYWLPRNTGDYDFEAHDVCNMLALLKIARLASNPEHADSWVDLAGYAACGAEVASRGTTT